MSFLGEREPVHIDAMIDATIKEANLINWGDKTIVQGLIYGDVKERWADGTPITTSYITKGPDENGLVWTRNSFYQLEMA